MPYRFLLACCLTLAALAAPAHALDAVTLQLKWSHAFQFAGYYAAQQLGYYREAGLDVRIEAGGGGVDTLQRVLDGRAQFGVGTSSLLLARKAGKPVVALAVIFQHSPSVLLVAQSAMHSGPRDLVGKRVMVEPQSEELLAYLRQQGIGAEQLVQLPHSQKTQDLIDGKVDAMTAYSTTEPYLLERAGFAYRLLSPLAAGIDFYGDNLFTTEAEIAAHPARVQAFRQASLRGWEYAVAHPQEVVEMMLKHYPGPHSREFYLYEAAAMKPLMRTDLIEVGYMNPVRWLHIADTYADLGLLPRGFSLRGFLYQPDAKADLSWLFAAAALLGLTGTIALYIHRVNRRLARALAASKQAEQALRHMAQHDSLTGLANRALFADRLEQALAGARRDQQHLALLFIDLDGFKPVNDQFGHGVGDLLLKEVAQRLLRSVRHSDSVARIGGDEFVVLLRHVGSAHAALAMGDKLCAALRPGYQIDGHHIDISASIGIAVYPEHGADQTALSKHADSAMYAAKKAGRDRGALYQAAG
ncbi:GGDEF domain-containing protein [Rugamonas rubra]|uniref:Diguanylate cyclase (GGDEF) domain-containing protein n=1 Tax=Rugamonas rubra TaxID=758825 RepID=A0A1I4KUK4_9BURK|nr:GGDEF domain-containing protein [Rugamonas rubra]SFL82316.1 diguanylate cyclase (GGDEF) domain-containing protein [Rugamonas rubra]